MTRECPECEHQMEVEYDKYVNAIIWLCPNCGNEIHIADN